MFYNSSILRSGSPRLTLRCHAGHLHGPSSSYAQCSKPRSTGCPSALVVPRPLRRSVRSRCGLGLCRRCRPRRYEKFSHTLTSTCGRRRSRAASASVLCRNENDVADPLCTACRRSVCGQFQYVFIGWYCALSNRSYIRRATPTAMAMIRAACEPAPT